MRCFFIGTNFHRYYLNTQIPINLEVAFKSSIAGEPAKHSSQREYINKQSKSVNI
jgi:hypothetical protein